MADKSQVITTTLAVAGFLFSFSTTVAAIVRTRKQDIQASRKELRELLERLIAIPREKLEAGEKYGYNSNAYGTFDGICNQENTMLSRQAAEIGRRLKAEQEKGLLRRKAALKYMSATDFYSVGNALYQAYNNEEALEFLQLAVGHSDNFNDEIAALRLMGQIYFMRGLQKDGRTKYEEASQIFGKYPTPDQYTQARTNISTQIIWAYSEANGLNKRAADEHLSQAADLANSLPYPASETCMLQVTQARRQLDQTRTAAPAQPFPTPPMPVIADAGGTK